LPAQVGLDPQRLEAAIAFARANETSNSRDLEIVHYASHRSEPFSEPIGAFKPRGDVTGVIVRQGYLVAEWGEPQRVDMTFSVTKSFLSSTVGAAYDRGLIYDVHDPVRLCVPGEHFESEHNAKITWDHLLRQTSDWEGTLWDKPDWADRPPRNQTIEEYRRRQRNEPGTSYKYNDVRVNLLALAALHVWRRPLPQVLREYVMDPIGASNTWRWHGYRNSWVNLDGERMQSMTGGGHWGGGMWISARDQARFGLLTLRRGRWKNQQVLSEKWVAMALTPTPAEPGYGFMNWFLNTGRKRFPNAPEASFAHKGAGPNIIYVDPENDLVIVIRWIRDDAVGEFLSKVLASVVGTARREPQAHFRPNFLSGPAGFDSSPVAPLPRAAGNPLPPGGRFDPRGLPEPVAPKR
jgi:CubicO group peptidase (beta-lactamase class C family)